MTKLEIISAENVIEKKNDRTGKLEIVSAEDVIIPKKEELIKDVIKLINHKSEEDYIYGLIAKKKMEILESGKNMSIEEIVERAILEGIKAI